MKFESCLLCTHIYEENEIKLGICLDCRDKIENGVEPILTQYIELDFFNLYGFKSIPNKKKLGKT